MVGAPLMGELSDLIGRKRVFMTTISGGIIGYLLSGWGLHVQDLPLLWAGRLISGFFAGNLTLCLAAIADITKSNEERVRNFGVVGTIGSLGFVFAILSGTFLSSVSLHGEYRPDTPLFIAALLSSINLISISVFFKESHLKKVKEKLQILKGFKNIYCALKTKGTGNIFLVYFFFTLSWSTSLQFLSSYLTDTYKISSSELPYVFLSAALVWGLANFVINPICAKRFHPVNTLYFNLLCLATLLFLCFIPDQPLPSFFTLFGIGAVSAALCWTTGLATLSIKTPPHIQGTLLGITQSIVCVSFILGPIIGEFVTHVDIFALYALTGTLSLIAALILKRKQYV